MDTERTEQLALLPDDAVTSGRSSGWRLDEATRSRGRQGVAAARRALAEALAWLPEAEAHWAARRILHDNAAELYRLDV